MKISEIIAEKDIASDWGIELLKVEINNHLKKMRSEREKYLAQMENEYVDEYGLLRMFRDSARSENVELILQYLISFIAKIPSLEEIAEEPVNPFWQFKQFVRNEVNLLLEKDIRNAILREYAQLGMLNDNNRWYYEGKIDEKHKELIDMLKKANFSSEENLFLLFATLEEYCQYLFHVRREDIRRIRKSDIYIYQLVRCLQIRYNKKSPVQPIEEKEEVPGGKPDR